MTNGFGIIITELVIIALLSIAICVILLICYKVTAVYNLKIHEQEKANIVLVNQNAALKKTLMEREKKN